MPTRLEAINEATRPAINIKTPTDWHPDALSSVAPVLVDGESVDVGSTAYESARKALRDVYQSASDIDQAIQACTIDMRTGTEKSTGKPIIKRGIDPTREPALAAAMATSFERVARNLEAGDKVLDGAIGKLEGDVATALRHPRANDTSVATGAAQIREYLARMPDEKRLAFAHKAIVDDGDATIAHAILDPGSSGYVSGFSPDQMAQIRDWAAERFATRSYRQLTAARRVKAHLINVTQRYVTDYFQKLPKPRTDAASAALGKLNG